MVDFVRRAAAVTDTTVIGGLGSRRKARLSAYLGSINIWFWAIVGLPTLIAAAYYFGIAADLYVSEVKFVVRAPTKAAPATLGALLQSTPSNGSEDTFAVHEYLTSRDAVRRLEREDDLRHLLSRPEGDVVTRFPGLRFWRHDFEALYEAYGRFVTIDIDNTTGVSSLHVKAYRPEDAQRVARALLGFSEQLVNTLNERARHDALAVFQKEVSDTEKKIGDIQTQLTAYRVKQKMLDPKSASAGPIELLGAMNAQLANAKSQLAENLKNAPHSPQIPLIRSRITSLERLIGEERGKITGESDSVATALSEYERLETQRLLAEKTLASAFTSLEQARLEAQRQQLFLETIAQPNLADYPLYPKRIFSFGTVVVSCLLVYGIAWLLVAGIREHAGA